MSLVRYRCVKVDRWDKAVIKYWQDKAAVKVGIRRVCRYFIEVNVVAHYKSGFMIWLWLYDFIMK